MTEKEAAETAARDARRAKRICRCGWITGKAKAMKFNLVKDESVKIKKVNLPHEVLHTKRPAPPKPKKTRETKPKGTLPNRIWRSENRDFEIHRYSGKHKVIDMRYPKPKLIKGGITYAQAVKLAIKAAKERI
jgi:hypothetical protein